MNIRSFFLEGGRYRLLDGTIVQAEWIAQNGGTYWNLRDQDGQILFVFLHDGRVRSYLREHRPDYFSTSHATLSCQAAHEQDIYDWFVDQGWHHLPDGTLVRAVLVERDDDCSWLIKDRDGQNLFRFREDGRVQTYVQVQMPYYSDTKGRMASYVSLRLVPCDLMIDDLAPA